MPDETITALKPGDKETTYATLDSKNPCTCERCARGIIHHAFCDVCGKGPMPMAGTGSYLGRRQYNGPDGRAAGYRYWCSSKCRLGEERLSLTQRLAVARQKRDLELARILTGQLAQLGEPSVPGPTGPPAPRIAEPGPKPVPVEPELARALGWQPDPGDGPADAGSGNVDTVIDVVGGSRGVDS